MPATAYVQRMLDLLNEHGTPEGFDPEMFRAFVRAVGRQLRAPYLSRLGASDVLEDLTDLFEFARQSSDDEVRVVARRDGATTILLTSMPDQPFIVDTVRLQIRTFGASWSTGFNTTLHTLRDDQGGLASVGATGDRLESLIRAEIEGVPEERMDALVAGIHRALCLCRAMYSDFPAMTDLVDSASHRLTRLADRMPERADAFREAGAFLRWLASDNFVFMGAISGEHRYGLMREEICKAGHWSCESLVQTWEESAASTPVQVRKGAEECPIHRQGRMDEIRVFVPSSTGNGGRVLFIQGLFTYRAVTQPSRHVPLLRKALTRILSEQESKPGSYRYRGIANAFDSLPTEFLFTTSPAEIYQMIDRVLEAEQDQKVRVHIHQKTGSDGVFVLSAIPKVRWSDKLRVEIQNLLVSATDASYCDHGVFIGRYDTMLVHYFLTGCHDLDEAAQESVRLAITDMATPWEERFYTALEAEHGAEKADEWMVRWGGGIDESYKRTTTPARAATDMALLDQTSAARAVVSDVFVDGKSRINLRLFQQQDIILSDILPILDNFGLIVIDQFADEIATRGRKPITIDTFRLKGVWGLDREAILDRAPLLSEGLEAVFSGHMTDDPLNRLLLRANIPWQAVDLVRAYLGYARQLGLRYTLARLQEILRGRHVLVHQLWRYFRARFDPDLDGDRAAAVTREGDLVSDGLREIDNYDQDVTFRTLFNLMESTIRTNFYRSDRKCHYISFKVDSASVRSMPSPRMKVEIYVHHRDVEGIHLRGGSIARGGIRWSDREDYRREVLDLVSTQMVKNVLIVPEGAKGGFFLKGHSRSSGDLRRSADELYKILIRGMLDLTDNIVDGQIVHPPRVVQWDGDDPYLVVAADKGTAHLSDTANGLSREYGFWLDDAFASGGSHGYDHKKVGITARGAWMTVRRHFHEMGVNPDTDVFTAFGIGDPSGDVFGNGVIETPKMKLVAAFNHLHVFLDPDPDPTVSYEERLRLFREAKGWEHYNTALLSPGGGIFDRKAKSIRLSPEVQQLLGVLKDELPVDAVLRLILRLDVDLFWNGGIGTYVKASHESHLDAGDPTNDELRVNASELRCRILAEGGNLGLTQAGRIEYAMRGGRLNNDAVDNSGGVDMSDHEVNLKILLNPVVSAGRMTLDERNALLESLTEEVAQAVLADNDTHGLQLSLDQVRSQRDPLLFSRTIDMVCRLASRSRAELKLPTDDDLARRAGSRAGLTRPELAVLAAHVKLHTYKALLADDEALIPGFQQLVLDYFPAPIRAPYAEDIRGHMLNKSIGMTSVLTRVVGESGALFFPTLQELTGAGPARVAGAWFYAMELCGAEHIRRELKASGASLDVQYEAWVMVTEQVQRLTAAWLAPGEPGPDTEDLARVADVLLRMPKVRGTVREERLRAAADALASRQIPMPLAHRIVGLEDLTPAREIALLHADEDQIHHTIIRYLAAGEASRILPALRGLDHRRTQGRWDPVATGILRNRFLALLRRIVALVPASREVRLGVDRTATRLGRGPLVDLQREMDQVLGDQPDVATLLVAEERIRGFLSRDFGPNGLDAG